MVLKPLYEKFTVVSFTVNAEIEEDIMEIPVRGNQITGIVLNTVRRVKKGDSIYFECVKARHENGNIYILQSFSITR